MLLLLLLRVPSLVDLEETRLHVGVDFGEHTHTHTHTHTRVSGFLSWLPHLLLPVVGTLVPF